MAPPQALERVVRPVHPVAHEVSDDEEQEQLHAERQTRDDRVALRNAFEVIHGQPVAQHLSRPQDDDRHEDARKYLAGDRREAPPRQVRDQRLPRPPLSSARRPQALQHSEENAKTEQSNH
jgi:hypothetical protein